MVVPVQAMEKLAAQGSASLTEEERVVIFQAVGPLVTPLIFTKEEAWTKFKQSFEDRRDDFDGCWANNLRILHAAKVAPILSDTEAH